MALYSQTIIFYTLKRMWELQRKNLGQFISESYLKLCSSRQREAVQFIPGAYEQGMHLSEPETTQPKKFS